MRSIILLCFLFGIFFCVFNNLSGRENKKSSEKQCEYSLSEHSPLISENGSLRILKPVFHPDPSAELSKVNVPGKEAQIQKVLPEKNFLQVKIYLKQSIYNLYFASGFHEPPLAA